MRTYLVFQDLPMHIEYRVDDMPLIPDGTKIYFKLDLRHPSDPKRIRKIDGTYQVDSKRLIFSTDKCQGLTQYLVMCPVE